MPGSSVVQQSFGVIGKCGVKSQSSRKASNTESEDNMVRALTLSAALAFGLASAANATMAPAPVVGGDPAIVKVAEDCGNDRWRDVYGHCHWFHNQFGTMRGTHEACPTWAHWYAGRCVHN
jgi:hypothetical protein